MKTLILVGLGLLMLSSSVFAFGRNNGSKIDGFDKYCFYSDGGTLTVGSTDICPSSNAGAAGQIDIQKSSGFGGLSRESKSKRILQVLLLHQRGSSDSRISGSLSRKQ